MKNSSTKEIIAGIKTGNHRLLARAISLVENNRPSAEIILNETYVKTGGAFRIGITGPPGAGKSTLTSKIAKIFRKQQKKVGIIAVDPTSPFSGGAVLGDRIRMQELTNDPGIFIRSMATRGSQGGLSKTAQEVADLLDSAGMDIIIFETIGVGQGELDVARAADTILVVLVPESGDIIQAMKAGLMEIADIFVINKSDREGAEKLKIELEMMLQLRPPDQKWKPSIVKTVADQGEGVEEVMDTMADHRTFLKSRGELTDKHVRRLKDRLREMIRQELEDIFWTDKRVEFLEERINEVVEHQKSPQQFVRILESLE